MGSLLFYYVTIFLLGLCLGMIIRDRAADQLYYHSVERGDYWFDKYMRLVDPDWEPLSERYRSEQHEDSLSTQEDNYADAANGHAPQPGERPGEQDI